MFERQCVIAAHRLEWRKGTWESWPSVITLHRIDDAAQHIVLGGSFRCDACANDKACDKHVFGGYEGYKLRSHNKLRRNCRSEAFAATIDTKQVRTFTFD